MNNKIKQILEEAINNLETCKSPKIKLILKKLKKEEVEARIIILGILIIMKFQIII